MSIKCIDDMSVSLTVVTMGQPVRSTFTAMVGFFLH